jgi:hypothetical protein
MQLKQHIIYLSTILYTCTNLCVVSTLAQTAPKTIPLELQTLLKSKDKITPALLTQHAGFIATQYNSKTDELSYWLLPETPSDLSARPLPFSIGTLKKKQINSATFNLGYLVTPNLKATCNAPSITADNQPLPTIGGTPANLPSVNPNLVPSATTGLKLPALRQLTRAQTVSYKTCALNSTSPTSINQLTPAEQTQFKQLLDLILNQKNISSTTIKPRTSYTTNLPTPTPSPDSSTPPIATSFPTLNLPPGVSIPTPKPGTYNVTKSPFAIITKMDGDKVFLTAGIPEVKPGSVLRIERLIVPLVDRKTGKTNAIATRTIGKVIVVEMFQSNMSFGKILSGSGIQTGDFAVLIQR